MNKEEINLIAMLQKRTRNDAIYGNSDMRISNIKHKTCTVSLPAQRINFKRKCNGAWKSMKKIVQLE